MILFLKILLAHLLGDFIFQRDKWVKEKEKKKFRSPRLYQHIGIHAAVLAVLLEFNLKYWMGFLVIITSHFLIDLAKLYLQSFKSRRSWFFIDQLFHLAVIFGVVAAYTSFHLEWQKLFSPAVLLFATALIAVTQVCSISIMVIISHWAPHTGDDGDDSLRKAGQFIGNMERLLIFIFITTQHWAGVGFLLAAKSIFRFGDLRQSRDRKLTEYILIGTLLSFTMAILVSLAYLYLSRQISE